MTLKQIQEEELKKFDEDFVDNLGWADKHVYRDGGRIHIERVKQFLLSAMEASAKGAIEATRYHSPYSMGCIGCRDRTLKELDSLATKAKDYLGDTHD